MCSSRKFLLISSLWSHQVSIVKEARFILALMDASAKKVLRVSKSKIISSEKEEQEQTSDKQTVHTKY